MTDIPPGLTLAEATRRFQINYIRRVLIETEGNGAAAARKLGLERSNLYRKMRQLSGLDSDGEQKLFSFFAPDSCAGDRSVRRL